MLQQRKNREEVYHPWWNEMRESVTKKENLMI